MASVQTCYSDGEDKKLKQNIGEKCPEVNHLKD
jgi:hypothetical protein